MKIPEARLTGLNPNEILLYLGYRGQECPDELLRQIRRCMEETLAAAEPKLVFCRLPVKDALPEGFPMEGNDVRALLKTSDACILFAATLGAGIERLLMRREVTDMASALILDACASTAIENVCDNFEADLRASLPAGRYLTDRFSPGYGDLPLDTQRRFCEALNASRRIGLTVSPRSLLIPRKSVTALLGISSQMQTHRARGCEVCSRFLTCPYRKEGKSCGR